ncbi:MAG: Cell division protein FtsL [Desulfotomaculum sp. 46_296]|nr:MAG: Cell division protein FtsL [Desulfotomaculum sp. 46_296]KUK84727.1 MAG: Cell division protein FtsL [Desulfofundulus kuznetsovii]
MISPARRQKRGKISSRIILPKRKKTFRFSISRLSSLILVILLIYLVASFTLQFKKLYAMQHEMKEVQKKVVELQGKNLQMREQLKLVQSDQYIEQMAREKLGLVKSGESRIITTQSDKKQ